jgi:D-alanyl-D-alanine carboxypeptidase/D-alanyl-D-alanine-endopeptidase (penicillin-binding protein 4)
MRKAGLNTSQYYIADGSGLSLYTYVTPQAETMMLRYAYSKPEMMVANSRMLSAQCCVSN